VVLWNKKNMFFGGVHTVLENSEGFIEGAGAAETEQLQPPDDYSSLYL